MSYVSTLFHIVFSTKMRQPTIALENSGTLYAVLNAELMKCKSKAYIINGTQDHVHMLVSISPDIALSQLMRYLKSQSSRWMKLCGLFPLFKGWEREYGAFSLSSTHRDAVYNYILNQRSHHSLCSSEEEYKRLVVKAGLHFYTGKEVSDTYPASPKPEI